jgi:iron complex transport system ATP-binding protein
VLLISHDLNLAAEYCHRLVLLQRGAIYAVGSPSEVLTEENIRRVYEISVLVEKNPLSGAPRVTPFIPPQAVGAGPRKRIHLICGGGSGADLARRFLLRGYEVSLGVLNIGDTDEKVGRTLGISMVLTEPFSPISEKAYQENRQLMEKADWIVIGRFPVGPGNLANLQATCQALEAGKKVLVLENDPENDFTGGQARGYYQQLRDRGAVFLADHSRLWEEVEKSPA